MTRAMSRAGRTAWRRAGKKAWRWSGKGTGEEGKEEGRAVRRAGN